MLLVSKRNSFHSPGEDQSAGINFGLPVALEQSRALSIPSLSYAGISSSFQIKHPLYYSEKVRADL
jgi:hypothetical protein